MGVAVQRAGGGGGQVWQEDNEGEGMLGRATEYIAPCALAGRVAVGVACRASPRQWPAHRPPVPLLFPPPRLTPRAHRRHHVRAWVSPPLLWCVGDASSRQANSVILRERSHWIEYYYRSMRPGEHFLYFEPGGVLDMLKELNVGAVHLYTRTARGRGVCVWGRAAIGGTAMSAKG